MEGSTSSVGGEADGDGPIDAIDGAGDDGAVPVAAAQWLVGVEEGGVDGGSGCGPRPWATWARGVMEEQPARRMGGILLGGRLDCLRRRGTWMAACRREHMSPEDNEKGRR